MATFVCDDENVDEIVFYLKSCKEALFELQPGEDFTPEIMVLCEIINQLGKSKC